MKRLPPLNALRAFDAAVRTGSFTRAGDQLHVTQGAISRQIKQLEDWLGKPVFVRHYQGLILTPAGSVLAKSLDMAFGTITSAIEQIHHLGARQRIAVNVPETFASRWLAPRLRSFHGRHPDIDLSITTNTVTTLREARQYDCLVMFLAVSPGRRRARYATIAARPARGAAPRHGLAGRRSRRALPRARACLRLDDLRRGGVGIVHAGRAARLLTPPPPRRARVRAEPALAW